MRRIASNSEIPPPGGYTPQCPSCGGDLYAIPCNRCSNPHFVCDGCRGKFLYHTALLNWFRMTGAHKTRPL